MQQGLKCTDIDSLLMGSLLYGGEDGSGLVQFLLDISNDSEFKFSRLIFVIQLFNDLTSGNVMRNVNLGVITELGNIVSEKALKDPTFHAIIKQQGWDDLCNGFLENSNKLNRITLGGHKVVEKNDPLDTFNEQGEPHKMLTF